MREWVIKNWRGLLLNGFALVVLATLLNVYRPNYFDPINDPFFESSGKWAIRFLLFSLAMTPLNIIFKWRWPLRLRKPAGLWAFAFAVMHYTSFTKFQPLHFDWIESQLTGYIVLGAAGLLILTMMAITSHRWAMRWLGKWWKRLHRLVYLVGLLVTIHAVWAITTTKRGFFRPNDRYEFYLYVGIVIVLLLVRLPFVRRWFRRRSARATTRDYVPGVTNHP